MVEETKKDAHEIINVMNLGFDIVIPVMKKAHECKKAGKKFEYSSLVEFIGTPEFKADFEATIKDIGEVIPEAKDFGWDDGLQVASAIPAQVKRIVEVFQA